MQSTVSTGFYKRRRGILEHLENGTIGLIDLAVHDYLCLKINAIRGSECSIPAGVCFTSAAAIYAVCPREVCERTIRRSLEHLEEIGWIKRWTIPGKHGNYPILVARAAVHDVSGKEYRVNADATTDWRFPVYVSGEDWRGDVRGVSAYREVRRENREEEKENPAAKPTPPADPRHRPFVDFAFKGYEAKHGRKPLWQGKDFSALKALLRAQSAEHLPLSRLTTLWRYFIDSTEAFIGKQGGSLAYFCSNIDKFSDGPLTAGSGKVNYGKPTATDLALRNARTLGLDKPVN